MSTTTLAPAAITRDDFEEQCETDDISYTGAAILLTIQRDVEQSNTTKVELDDLFLNSWGSSCIVSDDIQIDPRNYEATVYLDQARTSIFSDATVNTTSGNMTVSDIDVSYNNQNLTVYVVMHNSDYDFNETSAILIEIGDSTPIINSSGSPLEDIDKYWGENTTTDLANNFTDPLSRTLTYSLATDDGKLNVSRYEFYYRVN